MAGFKIELFKGIRPRISALKLPPGEAQTAQNTKLGSGDLEPWDEKDAGTAVTNVFYNKTIYLFDNTGTPRWFEWDDYVDVARGPIKDDSIERTYYTGVNKGTGAPRMTYTTIADAGGGGPYPEGFRYLGVPAPVNPPLGVSSSLPEDLPSGDRIITSITCEAFIIDEVKYTVHPGTGTDTDSWVNNSAALGSIAFDFPAGASYKVKRVVDASTVILESASTPGIFARTRNADKTSVNDWQPMDENGSTKEAEFLGWRIPEAKATIAAHRLRVGDVIEVTSTPGGRASLEWFAFNGQVMYQQSWDADRDVYVDGATHKEVRDARISHSAVEGASSFTLSYSEYSYDVNREASDATELEDRQYVYTYVSALGEEGPPSPPSNVTLALNGDSVFIGNIPGFFDTGYDITLARLYRTNSTSQGTEFQFVKEFNLGTSALFGSVTDTVRTEDLSEVIATTTWFPPDAGMKGLTALPNGMLVGFKGKNLYFCEPYFAHAWPAEYDQAVDYEIVGLAAFGNAIAVLTEGHPYVLSGSHPRSVNIRPYKINQACLNKESIATEGDRVYYASPDGLIEISVNGASIITEPYALKKEWASYSPSTMVGSFHDGKYFGFFDGPDNVTQPPRTCALSGTVTSASEDEYRINGETIILTLSNDTWVASGATFNAIRQDIIDGLDVVPDSNLSGFNDIIAALDVADVVRTSSTVVTITLDGVATYRIDELETVTMTVPATALTTSTVAIVASPTFTITPNAAFTSTLMLLYKDNGASQIGYVGRSINDPSGYNQITIDKLDGATSNFFDHGAYSAALDRWVFVGDSGGSPSGVDHEVYVSDDNAATLQFTPLPVEIGGMTYAYRSDELGYYWIATGGGSWHYSADGVTWRQIATADYTSFGGPVDYVLPTVADGFGGTGYDPKAAGGYFWMADAGVSTDGGVLRSANLSAGGSIADNWEHIDEAFPTGGDARFVTAGNGKVILVGSGAIADELCYMLYSSSSMTSIGTLANTGITNGLVYGAGIWCGLGSSGSTYVCNANTDDDTVIGDWTRTATVFNSGLITVTNSGSCLWYDEGSDGTNGYGFCVFALETDTGDLVLWTSPDASTWTERIRIDALSSELVKGVVGKYPESNLSAL